MTAQLRVPAGQEGGGRFAGYVRPPVPPRRRAALEDTQPVPYVVRQLSPFVPASVVSVCCPGCVYGVQA